MLEKSVTSGTSTRKTSPLVLVQNVRKTYLLGDVEVQALKGVSVSIAHGEFMAIAGSSGSGKTTLLNLIGCLDVPSEGSIVIDGVRTADLSSDEQAEFRAKRLGFVFQTFNLFPVLSALENVEYPLLLQGISGKERTERARAALAKVGLEKVSGHRPNQMSGGQRQRVAIARALVKNPSIILADEPTANLDRKTAFDVLQLMQTLNRDEKVTFVFSTHDHQIISCANRTLSLSDGQEVPAPPHS